MDFHLNESIKISCTKKSKRGWQLCLSTRLRKLNKTWTYLYFMFKTLRQKAKMPKRFNLYMFMCNCELFRVSDTQVKITKAYNTFDCISCCKINCTLFAVQKLLSNSNELNNNSLFFSRIKYRSSVINKAKNKQIDYEHFI